MELSHNKIVFKVDVFGMFIKNEFEFLLIINKNSIIEKKLNI